jgi:hypothetical protein
MQILVETNFQQLELVENKTGGLPRIRGVASQVDTRNQNGRVYRKHIMERELPKMMAEANRSDRIGTVDHPNREPKISDLALRFVDYSMVGNDVYVEIEILPTAKGQDLANLIRAGVEVGLSSRGYGGYEVGDWNGQESAIISDDYRLVTFDAVVEPSVADARISALETFQQIDTLLKTNPEKLKEIVEKACAEAALVEDTSQVEPVVEPETDETVTEEYDEDELALGEAKWSTKQKNALPNSSFLYVKGDVRKFPYKDAAGKVDLPHLRNALARIPDATGLTADEKAALTKKATALLKAAGGDKSEAVDAPAEEVAEQTEPVAETPVEESAEVTEPVAEVETPVAETTESTTEEVNPLQERVTELETSLTEKATALDEALKAQTALTEKAKLLSENAASLAVLLIALKTAIQAELDDNDWDDTGMLGMFGQSVAWRRSCEIDDEAEDASDIEDESVQRVVQIDSLKELIPTLLSEFRSNRIKAAITEATRHEKWGRAIAVALEEACTTVKDVSELLPTVKEMVELRLNAVPQAATAGVVTEETTKKPEYTADELYMRNALGLPV